MGLRGKGCRGCRGPLGLGFRVARVLGFTEGVGSGTQQVE